MRVVSPDVGAGQLNFLYADVVFFFVSIANKSHFVKTVLKESTRIN